MSSPVPVLLGGVRTPFGRFGGGLRDVPAVDLAAACVGEALARTGVAPADLGGLYLGSAIVMGGVMVPARQVLFRAGLPRELPSLSLDRACCSSLTAVGLACRAIRCGDIESALAGGMESMSQAPLLLRGTRWGQPRGDVVAEDLLLLRSPLVGKPIAVYTGEVALAHGVGRQEQDAWALQSHRRYFSALEGGRLEGEILPVAGVERDEQPRADTSLERLAALPTVYGGATVTAGNAPGLNDGAAAVLVAAGEFAGRRGVTPLAELLAYAEVSGPPDGAVYLPAVALRRALERAGLRLDDVALLEINEAFAATPLVSTRLLAEGDARRWEALRERTNVNGGAVAIGHPTGASGARILLTLARELRRRGGGIGAAAICGGFGQADAAIIRVG